MLNSNPTAYQGGQIAAEKVLSVIPLISLTGAKKQLPLMIDWVTAVVPYAHWGKIRGGVVMDIDENGVVQWEKDKYLRVQGSHSDAISLRTHMPSGGPRDTHVWISGNPAKFLQGHNVIGGTDLKYLVARMAAVAIQNAGRHVSWSHISQWLKGDFRLTRVDINCMIPCGSRAKARAALRSLSKLATMRHSGRGEYTGETLYFAKNSKYRAIKVYCKGDELQKPTRALPDALPNRDDLLVMADDALRIEVTLKSRELADRRLASGAAWSADAASSTFEIYLNRLQVSRNELLSKQVFQGLPRYLQLTVRKWQDGDDLREEMNPATYYRHKGQLLPFGIDIAAHPQNAPS